MKQRELSLRVCAMILVIALFWRILGAPLTKQDFENLETPMRQARLLLPERTGRIFSLWLRGAAPEAAQTMTQEKPLEAGTADEPMLLVYLTQEERLAHLFLPSKTYSMMACGMPVIGLCSNKDDLKELL